MVGQIAAVCASSVVSDVSGSRVADKKLLSIKDGCNDLVRGRSRGPVSLGKGGGLRKVAVSCWGKIMGLYRKGGLHMGFSTILYGNSGLSK